MKIAIFTPSFLPKWSGAEIFHHNLAVRLKALGDDPVVIVPRKIRAAIEGSGLSVPYLLDVFPANIWSWFKRSTLLAFALSDLFLARLQARHQFDVWHAVMTYPTGVSLIHWAAHRGVPHLVRCAGDDIINSPDQRIGLRLDPRIDNLLRTYLPRAQKAVALSHVIAAEYREIGLDLNQIELIPNAVDLARFQKPIDREAVRDRFQLRKDAFVFLAVGRNHPQKNYPALLAAAGRLKAQGAPIQLLVVGREVQGLEEEAKAFGLDGTLRTATIAPDNPSELPPEALVDAYRMADAFVMPSVLEGFSSALLEAAAAELPIVTTDAPGCRDFVRGGQDALVVPARNEGALADAMGRLIRDPNLRAEYSVRASERAKTFDWATVIARYRSLYGTLVNERRRTLS